MSIVGKHFPLSNRTIAMSIVTAVGSFGYFISPIFTNYSLIEYGWNYTLFLFSLFLVTGLIAAFFVRSPKHIQDLAAQHGADVYPANARRRVTVEYQFAKDFLTITFNQIFLYS